MERITVFDGKFWAHKNFPPVKDDTVDEFVDCVKELAARLAAYEETGLEPEAVEHLKLASMGKAIAKIKEFEGVPASWSRRRKRDSLRNFRSSRWWNNRCVMER